ncbi:MAG: hypothetical protein D6710_12525 [Nitrospirae bacterium]|nr:MAG: hypothetical protein D6710_12525 [Nitrospirota bacterium]
MDNQYIQWLKKIEKIESSPPLMELELSICKEDPYYWFVNYMITQDEKDISCPWKPHPNYPYLSYLIELWQSSKLLWIVKSRQIMMSWFAVGMLAWQMLFLEGQLYSITSKKEKDAKALLFRRMKVVYERLPSFMKRKNKWRFLKSEGKIISDDNSNEVHAMPQGVDQLRSYCWSKAVFDEFAFQDDASDKMKAILPTIDSRGGGAVFISTVNKESYFNKAIEEAIKPYKVQRWEDAQFHLKENPDKFKQPCKGLIHYAVPEKNTDIVWLHWSSHPDKDVQWIKEVKKQYYYYSDYLQEMEMDSTVETGDRIWEGFFNEENIISHVDLQPHWIYGRSMDPGYENFTAMLWFAIDPESYDIYIYREYYVRNASYKAHKKNILEYSMEDARITKHDWLLETAGADFNEIYMISKIDPQAGARSEHRGDQIVTLITLYGEDQMEVINGNEYNACIFFSPGKKNPVDAIRRATVLFKHNKIKVLESCENAIRIFSTYSDPKASLAKDPPRKPDFKEDHLCDALFYMILELPPIEEEFFEPGERNDLMTKHFNYMRKKLTE